MLRILVCSLYYVVLHSVKTVVGYFVKLSCHLMFVVAMEFQNLWYLTIHFRKSHTCTCRLWTFVYKAHNHWKVWSNKKYMSKTKKSIYAFRMFLLRVVYMNCLFDSLFVYSLMSNFSAIWLLSALSVTGLQIHTYA
jgi:hypothetical protein